MRGSVHEEMYDSRFISGELRGYELVVLGPPGLMACRVEFEGDRSRERPPASGRKS